MRRLVIETAGAACSVALFDGEALTAALHERVGRGHAERLLPMIAELAPGQVDEILVDRGPGSFTGLRVGLAAAIGLGIGWCRPVRGYDALALLAVAAPPPATPPNTLAVATGGGHGQVFVQLFALSPLRPLGPAASLYPDAARALMGDAPLVGDAAAAALLGRELTLVEGDARLALRLPSELRAYPPAPVYGRGADAKPLPA